ncbi:AMP-binding protein [Longirhabdus pacifica]|uniref:AMP-binding protein n=1 Tax=Longirhabdus pacifica TaxID=2305227 RepID=UPI0010092E08|nr:AMP-binding protein [Longirhabdus pacifica]
MFKVNETSYTALEVEQWHKSLLSKLHSFDAVTSLAMCMDKPSLQLAYILFCKQFQISLLLLESGTPLETAKQKASQAGCDVLVYSDDEQWLNIEETDSAVQINSPSIASLMVYSSGTTGQPKLIRRSYQEVDEEIDAYNSHLRTSAEEVPIMLVPVTHAFGLIGVLAALARGVKPVIVSSKNPKYMLKIIGSYEQHIVYGVPHLFQIFIQMGGDNHCFHKIITAGSLLPSSLFQFLQAKTKKAIMQQYGNSELGCITLGNRITAPQDVGTPLTHLTVEIVTASNNEIIVRHHDDVIHTNDSGYWDENGHLQLNGRIDDIILVGGKNVIPYEVEQVILRLDDVKEVVVYKTNHPVLGDKVKAKVVIHKGNREQKKKQIQNWCLDLLPRYKVPAEIHIVEHIPRNKMGKISRKHLQELEMTKS